MSVERQKKNMFLQMKNNVPVQIVLTHSVAAYGRILLNEPKLMDTMSPLPKGSSPGSKCTRLISAGLTESIALPPTFYSQQNNN